MLNTCIPVEGGGASELVDVVPLLLPRFPLLLSLSSFNVIVVPLLVLVPSFPFLLLLVLLLVSLPLPLSAQINSESGGKSCGWIAKDDEDAKMVFIQVVNSSQGRVIN